ncbi:hypothetical protein GCK72_011071 [Caenorhabditis remanei]|uniref:RAD50-interacting protein 1 n=1 Tax=Caenorhabditis remanei TaxID=31234 RepID=A0A6A5H511_CAERE|nr:hypothetical protein GCK72_011071 [Caenorhabditis remanei]KAF1762808.1 hypothetical protein GCK72_011071 [Caenorhabditis remanei]
MQALQSRLEQLENATGSDIWEILKASEQDLRQDLSTLNTLKEDKEKRTLKALEAIKSKKKELKSLRNEIESLQNEYKQYIISVEETLKSNGLDMKQVVGVFQKVLEDSLSEKKSAIIAIIESIEISSKSSIQELREPIKSIKSLISDDQNQVELRNSIENELRDLYDSSIEIFRSNLWSLFQKQGIPIQNLEKTQNFPDFLEKISEIFEFSSDLDEILSGNHAETTGNLIGSSFGQLTNLCLDMIENERERDADFEWILTSATKWAKNLKEVVEKGIEGMSGLDEKYKKEEEVEERFNQTFFQFIGMITKKFVKKNLKDPMIFSKLAILLHRFEELCEFDISNKDLFEPLYEPEIISKWVLLEVELFTISINKLLSSSSSCFTPLPAIFIGGNSNSRTSQWASEITVFLEQWIHRVEKNVESFGNSEIQMMFYECQHTLWIDLCDKIRAVANRLYSESTWSNDVYLVMNSVWELRRIIQTQTIAWPIGSFEVERIYENEWNRLSGMIVEYLNDLIDSMDRGIRSSYQGEKKKWMMETFYHIQKCLNNCTVKASRPSRSPLMNVLTEELFKNLQTRFDKWKTCCSIEILGSLYTQIYSNLLPQLDEFERIGHWTRGNASRSEMCRLDALMKMAANCDPSGELVRIAFRSIDEEQVIKMLAELGIHSTSDHAFQDYQILAENWNKIEQKQFDYGDF